MPLLCRPLGARPTTSQRLEGSLAAAALAGAFALVTIAGPAAIARGQAATQTPASQDPGRKNTDRLAEPWPDDAGLRKRRLAAENLPLFKTSQPLTFTLAADFKAVNRDREVDSAKRFPGVLTVAGETGQPLAIPVQLGTRGNLRLDRRTCTFAPLRVEFPKNGVEGTVFERQGSLKLVTHCQNSKDADQLVLGEALAYRIANLLTPASFRVRLARATYVQAATGKKLTTRWAIFIEDQDDVARRMQGRIAPLTKKLFRDLDQPSLLRLAVFQTLIGNTDYSIHALHNVRLVQDREGILRPVGYDFDVSGLVNPPYGAPDRRMNLSSLRERRYRGPCLGLETLEPALAELRAKRAEILALYDAERGLGATERQTAKDYLAEFFDIISSARRSKTLFVERCRPASGM